MSKRPISIRQVAEEAGVSTATVSNVFSGKKAVRPELAEHVRSVADRLGYVLNRAASDLRSGQSRIVSVLVPDLADPFFTSLVNEVEARAQADEYDIILANSKDNPEIERRRALALLSWQPAGLVIVPCSDTMPEHLTKVRSKLPIVIADRGADATGFDTVRIDNADAGLIAAKHLVELGHRNILIAGSELRLFAIRERCRGACERIEAAGGSPEVIELSSNAQRGAEVLARWLERNTMPTAIMATNDMTTLAILTCLAERKIDAGGDVSVVGFDDYPWMSARRTPITAVRQPVEELAHAIWMTLRERMVGAKGGARATSLLCSLRVRASTRRVTRSTEVTEEEQGTSESAEEEIENHRNK